MKQGRIYHIKFLDHCDGGKKPIEFEVFGRIARLSKEHVTVLTWGYPGKTKLCDDNTNFFSIVRSAITSAQELKPTK